ncbi:MAG: hypothetical protein LBL79_02990 [Prevotella sp.]|jgi:hypothetical protein|nr:hypothetical protein [Prevotella sp.]
MKSGNHKKLIKKIVIAVLCVFAFVGASLLLLSYIYFPRWVKSWVDFRPRPPYLPISVPLRVDQAPDKTTVNFIASEDDLRIIVLIHYNYSDDQRDKAKTILANNRNRYIRDQATGELERNKNQDTNIPQKFLIELSRTVDGREEILFLGEEINPSIIAHTKNQEEAEIVTVPLLPRKNEIYRLTVTNMIATDQLKDIIEPRLYICQGCLGK